MSEHEIKLALTAEEWASVFPPSVRKHITQYALDGIVNALMRDLTPQGLAAVALFDEPFGFTWEDVDEIEYAATELGFFHIRDTRLPSIASRIAALLPPRTDE